MCLKKHTRTKEKCRKHKQCHIWKIQVRQFDMEYNNNHNAYSFHQIHRFIPNLFHIFSNYILNTPIWHQYSSHLPHLVYIFFQFRIRNLAIGYDIKNKKSSNTSSNSPNKEESIFLVTPSPLTAVSISQSDLPVSGW